MELPAPEPSAESSPSTHSPSLSCFGSEEVDTGVLFLSPGEVYRATKQLGTGMDAYKGGWSCTPHLGPFSLSSSFSLGILRTLTGP